MIEEKISKYIEFIDKIQRDPSKLSSITGLKDYSDFYNLLLDIMLKEESENYNVIVGCVYKKNLNLKIISDSVNFILNYILFNPDFNYFVKIGVSPDAAKDEITRRWKKIMLIFHPDRLINKDKSYFEISKIINEIYSVLSHHEKRIKYENDSRNFKKPAVKDSEIKYKKPPVNIKPVRMHSLNNRDSLSSSRFGSFLKNNFLKFAIFSLILCSSGVLFFIYITNKDKGQNLSLLEIESKKSDVFQESKSTVKTEVKNENIQPSTNPIVSENINRKDINNVAEKQEDKKESKKEKVLKTGSIKKSQVKKEVKYIKPVVSIPKKDSPVVGIKNSMPDDYFKKAGDQKPVVISKTASVEYKGSGEKIKKRNELIEENVDGFVRKYIEYYKSRDISRFMSVYSLSAKENNRSFKEINSLYKKYFEKFEILNYRISNLKINYGDNSIVVNGKFEVEKRDFSNKISIFYGTIIWKLVKENNSLKIIEASYLGTAKEK